jgi:hypothetical protein
MSSRHPSQPLNLPQPPVQLVPTGENPAHQLSLRDSWLSRVGVGQVGIDEARGYRVLAPAYPGFEVEVEALNRDPSPVERLTVPAIMAHLEAVVGRSDAPPILMGHSAGGAFVQLFPDRGLGAVGVAINSAPTEGVRVTPLSQLKRRFRC